MFNSLPWSTGVLDGSSEFDLGRRSDSLSNYFDGRPLKEEWPRGHM